MFERICATAYAGLFLLALFGPDDFPPLFPRKADEIGGGAYEVSSSQYELPRAAPSGRHA